MKSKGELVKNQKLTVLVIFAIIFVLIFLYGSQALSKRPPWRPNYYAVVEGDLVGDGEVKLQRGTVRSGPGDTFYLCLCVIDFITREIANISIFGLSRQALNISRWMPHRNK